MGKNHKIMFGFIVTVFAVIFILFVSYYQKSSYRNASVTAQNHAIIIAKSLWNYERETSFEYLKIAAQLNSYKSVTVYEDSGKEFISLESLNENGTDSFLSNTRLLPVHHIEKEIFFNDMAVGKVVVDWENRAVFVYLYIFLCLLLVLIAIWFFLSLLTAKSTLEERVIERTADLNKSKDSLRISEERLELALAGANDGVWDWNLSENTLHFDARYYTMIGYEPGEFPSDFEEWRKRVHRDDVTRLIAAVEDYLAGRIQVFSQEFRLLNKQGDYQWIRGRGKIAARDEDGTPTRFIGTHSDINEQKLLEASRDEAYIAINSSPLIAIVWKNEPGWPVDFVTDNVERVLGYQPDELLMGDIRYDQIIHPYDLTNVTEEVLGGTSQNDSTRISHKPYRVITKTGQIKWINDQTYITRNDRGEITHFHGILVDITEKIEAEEAEKQTSRILTLVLNNIPVRVFWKDTESVYLGSNTAFAEDAGVKSPEELVGKTDYDLNFEQQAELYRADDVEVLRTGKSKIFFEEPQGEPGGKMKWLLTSKVPMRDEQQNIIGLLGTYQDITDRKMAEEELRNLRNYLANIIDSMPSVLIGVDKDGLVTQWNSKAQQVTGVPFKLAKGQPLETAFPLLSGELDRVVEAIKMREVCSDPRQARKEDDQTRYEDVTIYPLVANGVEGAVIRVDDVTEQVRLEEMMVQSEKMLSVGGLAAGMAHEINNPLAGMIQTANVMKSRLGDLEMVANQRAAESIGVSLADIGAFMEKRGVLRMIDTINDSGKRVAEIVDNMLSFARKTDATFSSHDPVQLLDQILYLASTDYDLKKEYDFKTIQIIKEYDENLPTVPCESAKIQQVLLNILRNGAQAMQADLTRRDYSPCFVLRLVVEKGSNMLRIEIEDNGPGIDSATQSRIFEPFFTTKPVGEGTGLGLSVSYFIITQNHGGTMDVVSEEGSGAMFIIRLPLA